MSTTVETELMTVICVGCHTVFGMSEEKYWHYKNTHKSFKCPYCFQGQYFSDKSEKERLRDKLIEKQKTIESLREMNQRERDQSNRNMRRAIAHKGHYTRMRKKISKGQCPCCNKVFKNLKSHMVKQHPNFGKSKKGKS
jgi:hypothetical protein